MSSGNLERLIGQLEGTQGMILQELRDAKESRKAQYEAIEEVKSTMNTIHGRVSVVEASLTEYGPTIQEFLKIKQQVVGAGALGKYLWVVGAALIAAAYKFREGILEWLAK